MSICTNNSHSFFETKEWLDTVVDGEWESLEIKNKDGLVQASFPIVKMRKYGCKILGMPPLTQTLGIYIKSTGSKLSKKLEREKKLINEIIEMLPKGYSYDFYLDVDNEYVLPFHWNGFNISPMFTYRLEDLTDLDLIWGGLKENIRTDIRKAKKILTIKETNNPDILYKMQEKVFLRQGRHMPHSNALIADICAMLIKHEAMDLLYAEDNQGNIHAATLFVYDESRCYYLMSGADPEFRKSGATSLLVWEGIKRASEKGVNIFDFEGSMIEDIERFVRAFGAKPRAYYHVMKYRFDYMIISIAKNKAKKILGYR